MARFQKGVSGNPGGRPKLKVDMRERARVHAGAAIDTLLVVMHDGKAPPAAGGRGSAHARTS